MKNKGAQKDWGSLKIGRFEVKTQTLIFILGLIGIVLIGIGPMLGRSSKTSAEDTAAVQATAAQYTQDLETRLAEVLRQVEGVGDVRVMVTLENGYSYEYAKSQKINNDILEDVKAEDSVKTQEKLVTEESYIMVDGPSGKEPLVTMELEPQIKGVVVVCEGGDEPAVVGKVVETVKVALRISSTQITVSKLATGEE